MEHWRELELKTGLSFREKEGSLLIKPRLMLNRFDIGALLLFVVGFCLIVIALWKTDNAFDFYVVLGFGVILEIGGALATIKTLSDFLLITDSEIVFRNSLKEKKLKIEQGLKVKVKTKKIRSRTRNWHKSRAKNILRFSRKSHCRLLTKKWAQIVDPAAPNYEPSRGCHEVGSSKPWCAFGKRPAHYAEPPQGVRRYFGERRDGAFSCMQRRSSFCRR